MENQTETISNQIEDLQPTTDASDRYDAFKPQRFEFVVTDGGEKFDTAHIFNPITDERWLEFLHAQKVQGKAGAGDVETSEAEAVVSLWNDIIIEVENVELEAGARLADVVEFGEKRDAIQFYIAVAALDPEAEGTGKRRLGIKKTRVVVTEAHQDGRILSQRHELRVPTLEDVKRYESILRRRFRQESVRGLRRAAKIQFVPQDDKFAKLYDDMLIAVSGFVDAFVPMRFKVAVLDHLFASDLDEKK